MQSVRTALWYSIVSVASVTLQSIRREAPKIGGSFAVWGGLFSTFDCTLVALRKKVQGFLQQSLQPAAVSGCCRPCTTHSRLKQTRIQLGSIEDAS
jgi:Tim17/Tim22/Tim23/Pmp24 family